MNRTNELILVDPEFSDQKELNESYWHFFNEGALLLNPPVQDPERYAAELIYEIQKHPKNLTAHVLRIFFCYRANLIDPLYAALVDFLIVLNKRGSAIRRRMVSGAISKLSDRQGALLKAVISNEADDISLIEGNGYSIFCKGIAGTVNLVEKSDRTGFIDSDPLKLAQDAVEYSQLDEALLILENALNEQTRGIELHEFLLELYKLTMNRARFEATHAHLRSMESFMTDTRLQNAWNQLKDYFEQQ